MGEKAIMDRKKLPSGVRAVPERYACVTCGNNYSTLDEAVRCYAQKGDFISLPVPSPSERPESNKVYGQALALKFVCNHGGSDIIVPAITDDLSHETMLLWHSFIKLCGHYIYASSSRDRFPSTTSELRGMLRKNILPATDDRDECYGIECSFIGKSTKYGYVEILSEQEFEEVKRLIDVRSCGILNIKALVRTHPEIDRLMSEDEK